MAQYDILVLGGGPAGHAAALKAASLGASVGLVERERLGGACVNFSCIPTDVLLSSAATFIDARELAVLGVIDGAERFNFARAAARADALVSQLQAAVSASLRMAKVTVIRGQAAFTSPTAARVDGDGGVVEVTAEAFVVATGTRWEPPAIPGLAADRVLTPDAVQRLKAVPASAVVIDGGAGKAGFGVEYAFLLAVAGAEVVLATAGPFLPALDRAVADVARAALGEVGIRVIEQAAVTGTSGGLVSVSSGAAAQDVAAQIVVAADPRRPLVEGLGLEKAGVWFGPGGIPVDRRCATNVPAIFAAGDVTGGAMLSSASAHMGEVAAENACGGTAVVKPDRIPRVLHSVPAIGWVGLTEEEAREEGYDVVSGVFDLSFNARAVALGARQGLVKVVADRGLGEILGVHAVGPGVVEMLNVAALAMQAEVSVDDLAALIAWHPSVSEGLREAARRARDAN